VVDAPNDTVLVTGATGLVGHNLVRHLLSDGYRVAAFVRDRSKGERLLPADCTVIAGDITDPAAVEKAIEGHSIVFHAAGIPEQWLPDPRRFFRVNVEGSRTVARACIRRGVGAFIYISTLDVFAPRADGSFDEDDLDPQPKATVYQRSKQEADHVITELLQEGLPAVFIHPAAVYGPGPPGSLGLNAFLQRLCSGTVPVVPPGAIPVVLADDVATGCATAAVVAESGERFILSEATRSFSEIARLVTTQLGHPYTPKTMPLWSAKTLASVAEAVSRITRRPPLLHRGQLRASQRTGRPVISRARERLGWRPTPFPEGIEQTVSYLRGAWRIP